LQAVDAVIAIANRVGWAAGVRARPEAKGYPVAAPVITVLDCTVRVGYSGHTIEAVVGVVGGEAAGSIIHHQGFAARVIAVAGGEVSCPVIAVRSGRLQQTRSIIVTVAANLT